MSTENETDTATECCCSCGETCCPTDKVGLTYGAWLLRLWLAVRAIQTGIEKYTGTTQSGEAVKTDGVPNPEGLSDVVTTKVYGLSHYHGVPTPLLPKFQAEPLMQPFKVMGHTIDMLPIYDKILGPTLLVLGLMTLLGIAYRTSLFLQGLLYISLTWGLILIKQDDGVSWLGVHMILIALALMLAKHNRCALLFKKW